jgi:hypothetical protein
LRKEETPIPPKLYPASQPALSEAESCPCVEALLFSEPLEQGGDDQW